MTQIPKIKPIRLRGKDKTEFRIKIGKAAGQMCQSKGCNNPAPIKADTVFRIGHLSHIKSIGSGGGDTEDNVQWLCFSCHINVKHGPRWSTSKCGGEWYAGEWCKECHAECGLEGGKK